MNVKPALATITAALALALAPSALAQDYCVPSCSGSGTPKQTLEDAIGAANSNPGPDRILLAAGTYTAPDTGGFSGTGGPVEIIGAGTGSTTVTGPPDTSTVLNLPVAGSRVTHLSIQIPLAQSGTRTALAGNGLDAEDIEMTAEPGITAPTLGASLWAGSTLERSKVSLPLDGAFSVGVNLGDKSTVRDSSLSANRGVALLDKGGQVERDRINATNVGVAAMSVDTTVANSLIEVADGGIGVYVSTSYAVDAATVIRNSTLVGSGAGSEGVSAVSNNSYSSAATVDSSIIHGFNSALVRASSTGKADVAVAYSDFDPSAIIEVGGTGSVALGAGNIDADPLFASTSDRRLSAGSPAVDAGNPDDLGDSEDLGADPRVADGDDDGTARRDIGAFERQPPVVPVATGGEAPAPPPSDAPGSTADTPETPTPATVTAGPLPTAVSIRADRVPPLIANLRILSKRRLSFSVSEYAMVHVVIRRRVSSARLRPVGSIDRAFMPGGARLAVGRVRGKALPSGNYTATVTANDAAQNRSAPQVVRFRVG